MKTHFTDLMVKTAAAAAMAAALTLSVAPAMAQDSVPNAPAAPQKTPAPKILVIDRSAILRSSKVGEDIAAQVKALSQKAEKELKGESEALKRERGELERQAAILSAEAKQKKLDAFQKKAEAFQAKVQKRQEMIQGGVMQARQTVEQALGPILQGVMAERGANLLMDRNAIILGTVDVDVTQLVIERLNKKLPSVKVELAAPPKGDNSQG